MTKSKQQASRIRNEKKPTANRPSSKTEGHDAQEETLASDTMDDARVEELTRSILEQRTEALEYLAKR